MKNCIIHCIFKKQYTNKIQNYLFEISFFKENDRKVNFLTYLHQKQSSNSLFCSYFRMNLHQYNIFLKLENQFLQNNLMMRNVAINKQLNILLSLKNIFNSQKLSKKHGYRRPLPESLIFMFGRFQSSN